MKAAFLSDQKWFKARTARAERRVASAVMASHVENELTAEEQHEFPLLQKEAQIRQELMAQSPPIFFVWLMQNTQKVWVDQAGAQAEELFDSEKMMNQGEGHEHQLRCDFRCRGFWMQTWRVTDETWSDT